MESVAEHPAVEIVKEDFSKIFQKHSQKALLQRSEALSARLQRLKKLRQWVNDNKTAISEAVYKDFRKPAFEADLSETFVVLADVNQAIRQLTSWARPKKVSPGFTFLGTTSFVHYEPKGVCLIIAPWNYPFNLAVGPLISAIAAGNTVILKPSELTPATSKLIKRLAREVFDPSEVFVAEGGADVSQALLELPFNHIFFTGSTRVGKIVMKAAARHLVSVTLELGGKSPVIIDASADLEDTAEKVAWGKLLNAGQTCVSPDYVFVHQSVKEAFLSLLSKKMEALFTTSNSDFRTSENFARIVNAAHFQRLSSAMKEALAEGAQLVFGGKTDESENYVGPAVLTNVPMDSTLMTEEIFGPILPVFSFTDHQEVIGFVNQRPKPLSLYVFSKSKEVQRQYRMATSAGSVCVNDVVLQFQHPNLPFGGVNESGIGKSHGRYGFIAFSNEKSYLQQRIGFTSAKLLYPPYTSFKKSFLKLLMKYA